MDKMSKEKVQYFTLKNKLKMDSTFKAKLLDLLGIDLDQANLAKPSFKYTLINEEKKMDIDHTKSQHTMSV
tara:strand:+ start:217 stop:429 length:213 start_codon:yes stop_codon:yes gene_type:complete